MATSPVEVQTSFGPRIVAGFVLVAFATLPCFASALYGAFSKSAGGSVGGVLFLAVVNGVVFGLIPGMLIWRRNRSVQRFDERGVTRFDGTHFPWSDYRSSQRTMKRLKSGATVLWQVELLFAAGSAIVLLRLLKNDAEVMPIVEAIEAGKNPYR